MEGKVLNNSSQFFEESIKTKEGEYKKITGQSQSVNAKFLNFSIPNQEN